MTAETSPPERVGEPLSSVDQTSGFVLLALARNLGSCIDPDPFRELPQARYDALRLTAQGYEVAEIADLLWKATDTIRKQRREAVASLEASGGQIPLANATRRAYRLGYLPDPDRAARRHILTAGLTRKESEVLWWVSNGLGNAEIANRMGVARYTVATHLKRIYQKTGANNRYHAVAIGIEDNLISSLSTAEAECLVPAAAQMTIATRGQ